MAYYCRDCSYKGKKRAADGHCPACGSAKFHLQKAKTDPDKPETRKGSLVVLVLLWGYLIAHIYWKLYV